MAAPRATADLGLGRGAAGQGDNAAPLAAAPPPLPPWRRQSPHRDQPMLLMDQATLGAAVVAQMLNLLAAGSAVPWHPDGIRSLALPVLVQLLNVLAFATAACWPLHYWRNRGWLLPILRVLPMLPPSTRRTGVGTALIMERPAREGLLGLLVDALRITAGTRLLPLACMSAFMMLPPTAALLTHAALAALTANTEGYCATQLLVHPLSRQRLTVAALALEYSSLPLVAIQPVAGRILPGLELLAGFASPDALCTATVSYLHLSLGFVGPTLLSIYSWRAPPEQAAAAAVGRGVWQRLLSLGQRALAAADRQLYRLVAAHTSLLFRCLVAYYILANCWLLCKLSAGLL